MFIARQASKTVLKQFQTRNVTGVVLMNMGGPAEPKDTKPFLTKLFSDSDIIELGGGKKQEFFCKLMVGRRHKAVEQKYEEIGGSPITKWHEYQAEKLQARLDEENPQTAPHKVYINFRYTPPFAEDTLQQMKADGVERAVAFPTYPQWSCTTSGSSMNELWRKMDSLNMQSDFRWSVIDRWYENDLYHQTMLQRMRECMENFSEDVRDNVVILFSAHSLPMKVVAKGDQYVGEIGATAKMVMGKLDEYLNENPLAGWSGSNSHFITWQSKVGPLPWMVPKTEDVLKDLGKRGKKHVMVVPIAFVCDHIETLHEIGIEYLEDAHKAGIEHFHYTEGFNESSLYTDTLTDVVKKHLNSNELHSSQYKLKCLGCEKPFCRNIRNPAIQNEPLG